MEATRKLAPHLNVLTIKMKKIRIIIAFLLIVAGAFCIWFWLTAWHQQYNLPVADIRTPADLAEQRPVFSYALEILNVNVFAPSGESMALITKLNGLFWRRVLFGIIVLLSGVGLLLLTSPESKGKHMALSLGRYIVAVLLCSSCFLICWSWHNRNAKLPVIKIESQNK